MSLKEIEDFLDHEYTVLPEPDPDNPQWECGDIWQNIAEEGCSRLPLMDVSLDTIDEKDYYGLDFSENQKVIQLFFTGSSNYFPGIWIGDGDINSKNIASMPIYIFDITNIHYDEVKNLKPVGNFRTYIETVLTDFIEDYEKEDEYMQIAKQLLKEVEKFPTDMIDKGPYPLKKSESYYS